MKHLLDCFIPPLNRAGFKYMVTGSVSAMFCGESRLTNDVDIVLAIGREQATLLASVFPESAYYLPPREVIEAEANRRQRDISISSTRNPKCAPTSISSAAIPFRRGRSIMQSLRTWADCRSASLLWSIRF